MRRLIASRGRGAARVLLLLILVMGLAGRARPAVAQNWNDPRSRALVEAATQRRAEQLADTALRDYQAAAHGYVAFLAQLGEGFRTPPKVIKTDELEDEVYWQAPNRSKQRIVGRRDTLLLPTDIAYHTDHLGIVQNNFPDIIRIGDGGDEVADVPHPLSRAGLDAYEFALTDSFSIGSSTQRIQVYEIKVRPKDDTKPRVVGAVYLDQQSHQVVRMNLTFTRAAFLDKALEDLSLVLENRLVSGRFWLPSRQEIEIRRRGEWLDYPARGIIRGRWEIGDYRLNQALPAIAFAGPEIVIAPPSVLAAHTWQGRILDSLPPDVRAISEPDIQRIQNEARALVRSQAMASAQAATLSARRIGDFVRFNRVEGLGLGAGIRKQLGAGWAATLRGRYGIDDKAGKGSVDLSHVSSSGLTVGLFAMRDFRDVSDFAERSGMINSLAAQEFGSDYTDPYLTRAVGLRMQFPTFKSFDISLEGSYEDQSPLGVHAEPVRGDFMPTIDFENRHAGRLALSVDRPTSLWIGGSELTLRGEVRGRLPFEPAPADRSLSDGSIRAFALAGLDVPLSDRVKLVTSVSVAGVRFGAGSPVPVTELVYLGGPVSAPGYDFHSAVSTFGYTGHVEFQVPAPFPAFSLGRYGKVPAQAKFAPYVHVAGIGDRFERCRSLDEGGVAAGCTIASHFLPALGVGYLLPFDIVRFDVSRGVGRGGRWLFGVDISREFWAIF